MLTRSLVTILKKDFPDWSRQMILEFLDELQRIIYTQNTVSFMRMYSSTTGEDPTVTITSGTEEYDIDTTNGFDNDAWRVCEVYEEDIESPLSNVLKLDATNDNSCKIVVPQYTSGIYYLRAYRFPTSLTSESIQLELPASYHYDYMYDGVCGMIERARSGKSDRWDVFRFKRLPELVKKLSENNMGTFFINPRGY